MRLVKEVAGDVFSLTVPVPVIMKDVNIYICRGQEPTIIDAGTNTPEVALATDEALKYLGITKLARVLITHWHVDHAGGAARLGQLGSEIVVGRKDFHEWSTFLTNDNFIKIQNRICQEWGVPESETYLMTRIYSGLNRFTQLPEKVTEIEDGDIVKAGNMSLQAIKSPGHCSGHMCYYNEQAGLLFTGDQLLPNQIAYPGVWLEGDQVVSGSLLYLKSLKKLASLTAKTYLPGHGDPEVDPSARCLEVFEQVQAQSRRHVPGENVYTAAYNLSKDRLTPDRLFLNLHLVAGWEEIARQGEGVM